ncbi:GNAT family N-acetyltransferase [Micromonospora sp. DT233]|uniref:GNAT family N-acetyltransferase n=1 Tax=Micromonospora sp. DT233 TaxID=3393432 RepID=UPI003CE99830
MLTVSSEQTSPPVLTEAHRIRDVDQAAWDGLARGASVYSSHAWLSYTEQYGDCEPRYLLIHARGRLVAALPTFTFAAEVPRYYDPAFLFPPGEGDPAGTTRPLLLGGTRQGYTSELLMAPGLPADLAETSARMLIEALRERPGVGMRALLYLTDAALRHVLPVTTDDDAVVLLDARARLTIDPDGLAGFRRRVSDNTAARMRKEMRNFRDAGCQVEVSRVSECHQHLGRLSAQVLQRYGHPNTAEEESERFARQAEQLDDLGVVLLARHEGSIVGFTQFFVWGDVMYGRVHGVDDRIARQAALYYNLTYYHAIEYAAEHGLTLLDLGCDSYEAKVRRAARLEPLWGVVLGANWSAQLRDRFHQQQRKRLDEFAEWDPTIRDELVRELVDR